MSVVKLNGASAPEWAEDLRLANEFCAASAKLIQGNTLDLQRGTVERAMFESLTPRQQTLVHLAQHFGGPMRGISLNMEAVA